MFSAPLRRSVASRGMVQRAAAIASKQQTPRALSTIQYQFTSAASASRSFSAAAAAEGDAAPKPSAFDVIVKLTFVDPNGARRVVPAYVGKTINDACQMHGIDIGPAYRAGDTEIKRSERWMEPTFGEGPACGFDHVILHGNGVNSSELRSERELSLISDYWDDDEVFDDSRLACCVTVTKEMDGMIVFVPDRLVCDIP